MTVTEDVCTVCGETLDIDEWDVRHSPHDAGCGFAENGACGCTSETHDRCCWECHPPTEKLGRAGLVRLRQATREAVNAAETLNMWRPERVTIEPDGDGWQSRIEYRVSDVDRGDLIDRAPVGSMWVDAPGADRGDVVVRWSMWSIGRVDVVVTVATDGCARTTPAATGSSRSARFSTTQEAGDGYHVR